MPFSLQLSSSAAQAGWKVKIHDLERLEPAISKVTKAMSESQSPNRALRYVFVGRRKYWGKLAANDTAVCRTRADVLHALKHTDSQSVWISTERNSNLAKTIVSWLSLGIRSHMKHGSLFAIVPIDAETRPVLDGVFQNVVGGSPAFKALTEEQLAEVMGLKREERLDVFIGGCLHQALGALVLVRGNLETIVVPLSMFGSSGKVTPDFARFEIGDYGHTIRFGEYEATADIVLWEVDREYRASAKAKQRENESSFGASLRRLRKQKRLSQDDFAPITRRTISRLEKGDVATPHGATLNRLAEVLGVKPEEILTY